MFKIFSIQVFFKTLLSLTFCALPITLNDDYERESKRWRSKSGSKEIIAEFVKLEKNKLHLRKSDGTEITTTTENLFPADAGKAVYLAGEFDDLKQFESIRSTIDSFTISPKVRVDDFTIAHRELHRAPYAGLAASIITARDGNDAQAAIRLISEVISRIESVREFSPERHTNTLIAAYNNKAIMHMKEKAFSKACIAFTKALSLSDEAEVEHVIHNATLVLNWANQKDSVVEITDAVKKKLTLAIQARSDVVPGNHLTLGRLCYAFNFDLALGKGRYEPRITKFAEVEDNCIVCGGDGVVDCRNCKEGRVTYQEPEAVAYDPVRRGPIIKQVSKEKPCEICNDYWGQLKNRGLLPCPHPECHNGKLATPNQEHK